MTTSAGGRIRGSVPRMGVGEDAANTLALVLHELATNSLKYGAMSATGGLLDVACASEEDMVLVWTERGGPPVTGPIGEPGYGSKLVSRVIADKLGGSIHRDWSEDGAVVTIRLDKARLER